MEGELLCSPPDGCHSERPKRLSCCLQPVSSAPDLGAGCVGHWNNAFGVQMKYTLASASPASPCCRSFATAAPAATIAGSYATARPAPTIADSFATARQAPLSQAPTAATGHADSFATARPAGPGQLGPGGSGDYAETFATAKQAPRSQAPSAAPYADSFATARPAARSVVRLPLNCPYMVASFLSTGGPSQMQSRLWPGGGRNSSASVCLRCWIRLQEHLPALCRSGNAHLMQTAFARVQEAASQGRVHSSASACSACRGAKP